MSKLNTILTILLVLAIIAVPVTWMVGMQRYSALLASQDAVYLDMMREEYEAASEEHEAALANQAIIWERKHLEFRSQVRESLLNSGVSLEILDAPPPEEVPDLSISQETYNSLKKGQSYEEIVVLLGREGNNILNLEDGSGLTSSYEWSWENEDGGTDTLGATFINGLLNHKTYSAFKL